MFGGLGWVLAGDEPPFGRSPVRFPFRRAVMGMPKPIAINAKAMNDPNTLKIVGGEPNPDEVQSQIMSDKPMNPKIEKKNRMKMGGLFCMNC